MSRHADMLELSARSIKKIDPPSSENNLVELKKQETWCTDAPSDSWNRLPPKPPASPELSLNSEESVAKIINKSNSDR